MARRRRYETAALTIAAPTTTRIYQRVGTTADITIAGTYLGAAAALGSIEARWNGGAWATLVASPAGGTFSKVKAGCAQGYGLLEVRGTLSGYASVSIGIGDVFLVAGQSNAAGSTTNNQTYTHATLCSSQMGSDYSTDGWQNLSAHAPWPLLATQFMTHEAVPMGVIQAALGASSSNDWLPGVDHEDRGTLYGNAVAKGLLAGGLKAVLWWQGESDAGSGVAEATYNTNLDTIIDAFYVDLGVKTMPLKLQHCTNPTDEHLGWIQAAIATAWGDNANCLTGPDLSDTETDDGYHLLGDVKVQTAADRWWTALHTAFYT